MDEQELRADVVRVVRELDGSGLNRGTSGNVSARFGAGMLVTPSGVRGADLEPGMLAYVPPVVGIAIAAFELWLSQRPRRVGKPQPLPEALA